MATLGDLERIEHNITNSKLKAVKALHFIAYGNEGQPRLIRKNLRKFNGFRLDVDSDEYARKIDDIKKQVPLNDLTAVCHILNLDYDGDIDQILDRVCLFLNDLTVNVKDDESESEIEEEEEDEDETEEEVEEEVNNQAGRNIRSQAKAIRNEAFALTFRDVEDSIRPFDGKDSYPINKWILDFEEIADITGWNELQKLIFAKKSLRGLAKLFVQSEKGIKSWKVLKRKLLEEFEVKVSSAQVHKLLMARKKEHKETVQEYVLVMREIGSRALIEPEVIIQYIIDGINDDSSSKIVLYGAKNFSELKEKVKLYEQIKTKKNPNSFSSHTGKPNFTQYSSMKSGLGKNEVKKEFGKEVKKENDGTKPKNCFNCGERGHKSQECPNKDKGVKCFKCNTYGHISTKCTKNGSTNQSSSGQTSTSVHTIQAVPKHSVKITIDDIQLIALLDTGSDICAIRDDIYEKHLRHIPLIKDNIVVTGIGCNKIKTLGLFKKRVAINEEEMELTFHIIPRETSSFAAIVGNECLSIVDISIRNNVVEIYKKEQTNFLMEIRMDKETDANNLDLEHISEDRYRNELREIVNNYKPAKTKEVDIKMKIILKDEEPVYERPRRLAVEEKTIVEEQIKAWLEEGIIKPSCSEFASPIVLVKKKCGATRICCDYRKINKKIIRDRFPLPLIEDVLDTLQNAKYYSTIDLRNGFFHVSVEEESTKYTSFVTPNGQYEFLKCPFGLCNSPAVFQRYVSHIFLPLTVKNIAVYYMDDIIIMSSTVEEGLERLKLVLDLASSYGLQIKKNKCQFLREKVIFLGYIIEDGHVQPSDEKSLAIKRFPQPRTFKQLQSFLGLTGYFRKFIASYASIAKPLSDLLKKDQVFTFGDIQKAAFEKLKTLLSSKPVLYLYRQDCETQLHTDASKHGYGACLMQKFPEDDKFHPVYFMSRKTTPAEEHYHSYELEVLAIIQAVKKFRIYLLGIPFKIITDCAAFEKTMSKRDLTTRVARWALLLEEYEYKIEHRSGSRMAHVDALSRCPEVRVYQISKQEDGLLQRLKLAQKEDDYIQAIRKICQKEDYQDFVVKNNILYKYDSGLDLIVVPKRMQYEIIRRAHEVGHFGAVKTEEIVKREFFINKLKDKVQNCIRNCIKCILGNKKEGKKEGLLHSIAKPDEPLMTYHVDHLGPLPSTNKQYRHIFAVIDDFTKFVWLYPVKSTTSRETIDKLKIQQKTFGNPFRIISDRGTAFTSNEFREYCDEENIQHVTITTGVPRGNGQIERINRTIIPVFTKLSLDDPSKWYKHVDQVQRALNSTIQRSIDASPFEVMMGVKMKCKEDVLIREMLEKEAVDIFQEKRQEIREEGKKQILKVQEENKKHYNLRRRQPKKYHVGDMVAIKRTQFGPGLKFHRQYLGPYEVSKCNLNERYEVVKVGHSEGPSLTTTCAEYMKPWVETGSESESDS